jgi:carbonic anhydrase
MSAELLTPDQALTRLQRGNARFVAGWPDHPDQSARRRREVADQGQQPFAAILTCADSRVPPEIVFDAGLGNLFVVRVAGNVLDDIVLGSLEYAVAHLHVPLIMVLGHDLCGAVTAAANGGDDAHSHIDAIVQALQPAVKLARTADGNVDVSQAIEVNIRLVVERLLNEPGWREPLNAGKLTIAGARYHLVSGEVTWLA